MWRARGVIRVRAGVLNIEELVCCDGAVLVLLPPTADNTDNAFVSVSRSTMTCCGVCSILPMVRGGDNGAREMRCEQGKILRQDI
jgi:hypothetical protein